MSLKAAPIFLSCRFWWEAEGVFTWQQRAELLNGSLSGIICDNSDIREVPRDAFTFRKYPSGYISCHHIPSINLAAWREERSPGVRKMSPCSWRIPKLYRLLFLQCIYMRIFYRRVAGLEICGPPRTIKNGDFILSSTSGKPVARYSCYHGFKLKGAAAIVCEGNRWSDQPPRCAGMTLVSVFFLLPPTCFTPFVNR